MTVQEKVNLLEEELKTVKGSKCEVYSRIVGYHRPVENWNESKQEEFKERTVFNAESTHCRF